MSFTGFIDLRPGGSLGAPGPCAYCGRDDEMRDYAGNCHGCGAPRKRAVDPPIVGMTGMIDPNTDWDCIDVTTIGSPHSEYIRGLRGDAAVPQPRPIKKG